MWVLKEERMGLRSPMLIHGCDNTMFPYVTMHFVFLCCTSASRFKFCCTYLKSV